MPFDTASVVATLGVVGPIVGGSIAWLYYRANEKHKTSLDEWRELVERTKTDCLQQIQSLKADYVEVNQRLKDADIRGDQDVSRMAGQLDAARSKADEDYRKLADRIVRLQVQNQALRGELTAAQAASATARAGLNPFFDPKSWVFCSIVADGNGRIISANPAINHLFHWEEHEVIGKNVKMLMAPRFHAAHDAGMAAVRARGGISRGERTMFVTGLTRDGEEFPLDVSLQTWLVDDEVRCGAIMMRRWLATTPAGLLSNEAMPVVTDPPGTRPAIPGPPTPPPTTTGGGAKS